MFLRMFFCLFVFNVYDVWWIVFDCWRILCVVDLNVVLCRGCWIVSDFFEWDDCWVEEEVCWELVDDFWVI